MAASLHATQQIVTETKIVSNGLTPTAGSRTSRFSEPTVKQIIAAARSQPVPARGALLLVAVSAVLLWASFTPQNWSPLAWIALVPLFALVRLERAPRLLWLTTFVGGFLFWLPTLQWLRLGDPSMYVAWFALASYLAAYWPALVWLARVGTHRCGLPLPVSVSLVWVGLEFVRAHLMTGFAWYMLGHTQYRWLELIQISDVLGAYGVSFVLAFSNGTLASLIPETLLRRLRVVAPLQLPDEFRHLPSPDESTTWSTQIKRPQVTSLAACLMLIASVIGYGIVRRGQAEFQPGPRVALIQGNFVSSLKHDPAEYGQIYRTHELLTGYSVPHRPDIIVWPETMFRWPLSDADPDLSENDLLRLAPNVPVEHWRDLTVRKTLHEMSERSGAAIVMGLDRFEVGRTGLKHFNSAALVTPDRGVVDSYDKLHRVVFGEYVPLKDAFPWLQKFTPLPEHVGLTAGSGPVSFRYKAWKVAPIICFEDTVPHLVRGIARSTTGAASTPGSTERLACLLNLTNDGWFHGSSELDQHLITSAFRAVELRTPLVRAVNTGISAVVDGDGAVREPEVFIDGDATWTRKRDELQQATRDAGGRRAPVSLFDPVRSTLTDPATGRWRKSLNAVVIDTVPLDNRRSFYLLYGDWFAGTCSAACGLFFCIALVPSRRQKTNV